MAEEQENMEDQTEGGEAEGEGEGSGEEAEAKKGGSKLIIIIAAALVVLGGAGAGAFFMLSGGDKEAEEAAAAAAAEEAQPVVQDVFFYELPEILVNLSSSGTANRFLKMKVNLELKSEADVIMLEKVLPRIIDDFQLYLRQLRVEDLTGASGIQRLKEALLLRANQSAQPLEINAVLFKEILVQ